MIPCRSNSTTGPFSPSLHSSFPEAPKQPMTGAATTKSGNAVCADLVPPDCRDTSGRFPAYHSCAEGTFQVEFALALWIEDISDAKSSPKGGKRKSTALFHKQVRHLITEDSNMGGNPL
ncbi:hypothetical protein AVEN_203576-1 [Araneus ventricosus]|uniref:Uncharacterized protein n=1 Tax=Araneus ventricosus TaxID=182803 RepID=A0A4Y2FME8_ARAVE|nr:hypothetical protein AVEN_203576-1 [Araneus ventricosus]